MGRLASHGRRRALACCALGIILAAACAARVFCAEPGGGAASPTQPAPPGDAVSDLLAQIDRLAPAVAERRPSILREHADLYALAMLKLEKAQIALSQQASFGAGEDQGRENLKAALEIWGALVEGRLPALPEHGLLERAYLALNDRSPQPYYLYMPDAYDGGEPFGLLVFLHGYVPTFNKLNWIACQYSEAFEKLANEARCIVLIPYGRSNTDFQGAGEDDVLRCIAEVKERYTVDADRVFLSGISMGGMGVWTIGAHYPDLFAALIPVASRGDFYLWKGIERGGLPGFQAKLAEQEFGAELLPNYRHLPCVIVHGTADQVMPIQQSERMAALLGQEGFGVQYVTVPGASHYDWDVLFGRPEVLRCLREVRRVKAPQEITYRTYTLKYGRAYWAEVTGIADWGRPADLKCRLDPAAETLAVETANLTGLRLDPPVELAPHPDRLKVSWNGRAVETRRDEKGRLLLEASDSAQGELTKTPSLCGPIREAYAGPFVLVHDGRPGSPSYDAALAAAADWVRFAQGVPLILSADEVSPVVLERCNLILFGTPEDNPLVARIAPRVPVAPQDGKYRVGDRLFDASRLGLSVIYPNPLAPGRCVVINSGPVWGRQVSWNHKYDMLPDFIIFRDAPAKDGTDANDHVLAGFFDQHWKLNETSTWQASDAP